MMKAMVTGAIAALVVLAASLGQLALAVNAQESSAPSITLFNQEDMKGAGVTVRGTVSNLQDVAAAEGFDGTANDYAFSLRAIGRWQVCMDAGFATGCREVSGDVPSLGEAAGSISSVRYIGPAKAGAAAAGPGPAMAGTGTVAAVEEPPMFEVDLYGSDLREIIYDGPGNDWKVCKASCDAERQCRAWTFVVPGRTEHGECFLKHTVPEPSSSQCCISGIKRQ